MKNYYNVRTITNPPLTERPGEKLREAIYLLTNLGVGMTLQVSNPFEEDKEQENWTTKEYARFKKASQRLFKQEIGTYNVFTRKRTVYVTRHA